MKIKTLLVGVFSALGFSLSPVAAAAAPVDKYNIVIPEETVDAEMQETLIALCQNMIQQMGGINTTRVNEILAQSRNGNLQAQTAAAILYITGEGVQQDVQRGLQLIIKSAQNGEDLARMMMASFYVSGVFGEQYMDQGYVIIREYAEKGNIIAMYTMYMLELSLGNFEQCDYWYNRVVECNNPRFNKAIQAVSASLLQIAQQGDVNAQHIVATGYLLGVLGFEENEQEAFYWCQKAAAAGNPESIFLLGALYYDGIGTAPDRQKAIYYITKAAELGVEGAQEELDAIKNETSGN